MNHYQTLLTENGKTVNDLPREIKLKINAYGAQVSKYTKAGTLDKYKENLEKQDIIIADAIQTFLEKDLPASAPKETDEQKAQREKMEAEAAKKAKEDKEAADKKRAEEEAEAAKKKAEEDAKAATMAIRNEIVKKANADKERLVHKRDLKAILGREPKSRETVMDISLVQLWMSEKYKIC